MMNMYQDLGIRTALARQAMIMEVEKKRQMDNKPPPSCYGFLTGGGCKWANWWHEGGRYRRDGEEGTSLAIRMKQMSL